MNPLYSQLERFGLTLKAVQRFKKGHAVSLVNLLLNSLSSLSSDLEIVFCVLKKLQCQKYLTGKAASSMHKVDMNEINWNVRTVKVVKNTYYTIIKVSKIHSRQSHIYDLFKKQLGQLRQLILRK